jgi:hypothetical protein
VLVSQAFVERPQRAQQGLRRRAVLIVRRHRAAQLKDREDGLASRGPEPVGHIVQALAARGIDAAVVLARRRKDVTRHARTAAGAGAELVVAAGGDRTVAAVARGLLHTNAVLGILPFGAKRNAVAARLGIPAGLDAACDLLARGEAHAIDIAHLNALDRADPATPFTRSTMGLGAPPIPSDGMPDGGWWGGPPKTHEPARRSVPERAPWRPRKVSEGAPTRLAELPAAQLVIVGPATSGG